MIDPKSLRIGNYIHDITGGLVIVRGVTAKGIWIREEGGPGYFTNFSGIPLTPEWLERFGFEKGKFGMEIKVTDQYGNVITLFLESGHICVNGFATKVNYVHQLQNLYFALKGQELGVYSPR